MMQLNFLAEFSSIRTQSRQQPKFFFENTNWLFNSQVDVCQVLDTAKPCKLPLHYLELENPFQFYIYCQFIKLLTNWSWSLFFVFYCSPSLCFACVSKFNLYYDKQTLPLIICIRFRRILQLALELDSASQLWQIYHHNPISYAYNSITEVSGAECTMETCQRVTDGSAVT